MRSKCTSSVSGKHLIELRILQYKRVQFNGSVKIKQHTFNVQQIALVVSAVDVKEASLDRLRLTARSKIYASAVCMPVCL